MTSNINNIIVDQVVFGYGAYANGTPKYVLPQCQSASFEITADATDIKDKDGNLVYRKYSGKSGTVTLTNAFISTSIIAALSGADPEIASAENGVVMPIQHIMEPGKALDITGYVEGTVVVKGISVDGTLSEHSYTLGAGDTASNNEFAIKHVEKSDVEPKHDASDTLILPTNKDEVQYFVALKKTVYNGLKITNSGNKIPKAHELFLKALIADPCDRESFRAAIIHVPAFQPSPEMTLAIEGNNDSQTMDLTGAMMLDYCSTNKELFSIYIIDEPEEVA